MVVQSMLMFGISIEMPMEEWTKIELYWDPLPIEAAIWPVDGCALDIGSL